MFMFDSARGLAQQLDEEARQSIAKLRVTDLSNPPPGAQVSSRPRILVVDDDPNVLRSITRTLKGWNYDVITARTGQEAVCRVVEDRFDAILSDIAMPEIDGIQLLREVRTHDLHVPVILITGDPAVRTAVQALEYGAFHYLTKPVNPSEMQVVLGKALRMHRMARVKQQAAELLGHSGALSADRAGLEASFQRALQSLYVAYQPIVDVRNRSVFGYEALLRCDEPSLPHPGDVIDAAERLDCLDDVGRAIRDHAAKPMADAEERGTLFVNLHVTDLVDPMLCAAEAPLSKIAERVVLEITERSSLDEVKDARARVAELRQMGFRIAVDDMGAGYAGLTSFALLEPEIVKLDMALVRDVNASRTKQKVIRSMTSLSQDMGMLVVAEGVQTPEERDALVDLGCDLLQGFLFAQPSAPFPEVRW